MQPIKVFYSYAHEDKALRDELEKHLGTLKRQGLIEQWHDRDISAGKDWKHEIDTYLNSAQIILLLISKDFIHSDYCYGIELSRAIQRCEAQEVTIIPILLRPLKITLQILLFFLSPILQCAILASASYNEWLYQPPP
jgi:hypothetical protein